MRKRGPLISLPFIFFSAAWRYFCRESQRLILQHCYGMQIGANCHIGWGLRFVYPGNIVLADKVSIAENVRFWSEIENGKLVLKQGVSVARDCVLDFSGGLTVEENALLSEGVIVYTHDHCYDPRSNPTATPLTIGMNAWIGARAIILPSVNRTWSGKRLLCR